jgi:hypothetical protein
MPDEHKTLEQRVADIEFNLKKLREENHQRVHFLGRKDCP